MTKRELARAEKLVKHFKKCGFKAFINTWFKAVQVECSTICIEYMKNEIENEGYECWIKPMAFPRKFPVCDDELSGKDTAAYLMVKVKTVYKHKAA